MAGHRDEVETTAEPEGARVADDPQGAVSRVTPSSLRQHRRRRVYSDDAVALLDQHEAEPPGPAADVEHVEWSSPRESLIVVGVRTRAVEGGVHRRDANVEVAFIAPAGRVRAGPDVCG
jgi:hypothetical protein